MSNKCIREICFIQSTKRKGHIKYLETEISDDGKLDIELSNRMRKIAEKQKKLIIQLNQNLQGCSSINDDIHQSVLR